MKVLTNIAEAIEMYYGKPELRNADIKKLFGVTGDATVARLKKPVLDEMQRRDVPRWSAYGVNTEVAFDVWGFDIKDLERRHKKLMEFRSRNAEVKS